MAGTGAPRLVASKLAPIAADDAWAARPRVVEALSSGAPVTLVSARSGSGKTVAVRQWVGSADLPVAWLNVDALDAEPTVFWSHLIAAIRSVCDAVDDEPELLLRERGPVDRLFLVALIAELELAPILVLVLDGLDQQLDRHALDGLALLVDRTHGRIRLVVTTQVDPDLPIGRWRSAGWVNDVRWDALRLTDTEAIELARRSGSDTRHDAVIRLNRALDGWVVAMRLALASGWEAPADAEHAHDWPTFHHSTAKQLADRLLAEMADDERATALELSVLDRFDPQMCLDLVGERGATAVRALVVRGALLEVVDRQTNTMRYPPLIRQLLEADLAARDPVRHTELHRRAARLRQDRGDVRSAFNHLNAIGEVERSRALLVDTAFDIVDRGDLVALRLLASQLPTMAKVRDPDLALELALVSAWGAGTPTAKRWCDHAEQLITSRDVDGVTHDDLVDRVQRLRCAVATLDADLELALDLAEAHPAPRRLQSSQRFDAHVTLVTVRSLLAARHPSRHEWIERAKTLDDTDIIGNATIPTLVAWSDWLDGRLDTASSLGEQAVAWLDDHQIDAHHWAFDTYVTAGWCRLSRGDIDGARELAGRAVVVSDAIPCSWNVAQAAYLAGRVELACGNAPGALQIVEEVRETLPFASMSRYAERLVHLAAEAAIAIRRVDVATTLAAELSPGPYRQLLKARIEPLSDGRLEAALADRADWSAATRIQAEVLLATRSHSQVRSLALLDLVEECAKTGWVLPFLGLGARADRALRSLPLNDLHPALGAALDRQLDGREPPDELPHLTPREQSLLELLPTHLSYAEMAERLFLSVNTIKSSLKGLYRKLDAHTRAEAVANGQDQGLI